MPSSAKDTWDVSQQPAGTQEAQLTLSEVVQAKLSRDQQGSTLQVLHLSVRGSGRKYIGSCQCFGVGAHYAWLRHVGQADAQAGLISLVGQGGHGVCWLVADSLGIMGLEAQLCTLSAGTTGVFASLPGGEGGAGRWQKSL